MKRAQRSLLAALLTLATGMVLVAIALKGQERAESQQRADERARRPLDLDVEQVQVLVLRRADGRVELQRDGELWRLVAPVQDLADELSVLRVLQALGTLRAAQRFDGGEQPEPGLAGLEPPALELELVAGSERRTLQVGAYNAFRKQVYARLGVDVRRAPIFLAEANLRADLTQDLFALRDKHVARCRLQDLDALEMSADASVQALRYRLHRDDAGVWSLDEPAGHAADSDTAASLGEALCAAYYVRVVDEQARDLARYGLDPPLLEVRLTQGSTTTALRLGAVVEGVPDKRYALRADGRAVVQVAAALLPELTPTLFELREKRALPVEPAQVARVKFALDDGRLVIVERRRHDRGGDTWFMLSPRPEVIRAGSVETFVRLLTEVEAVRIEEPRAEPGPGPEQLQAHGLLQPARSVSLFAEDGAELATLLVGAERGDELMVWRRGAREVLALERRALDAWPRILEDLLGEVDDAGPTAP